MIYTKIYKKIIINNKIIIYKYFDYKNTFNVNIYDNHVITHKCSKFIGCYYYHFLIEFLLFHKKDHG